jgi:DNA-binding transcriptional regulator YdaS (Cro superfamily)
MHNAIVKAIKLAGSQSALAKCIGISPQALGQQLRKGVILPKHCIAIEEAFHGDITRYELNPEHFGAVRSSNCVVLILQNLETTSTTI